MNNKSTRTTQNGPDVVRFNLLATPTHVDTLGQCIGAILERVRGLEGAIAADVQRTAREAFIELTGRVRAHGSDRIDVTLVLSYAPSRLTIDLNGALSIDTAQPRVWYKRSVPGDLEGGQPTEPGWRRTFDLPGAKPVHVDEESMLGPGLGMGIFLARQAMDEVVYEPRPGDNHWRLTKTLPVSIAEAGAPSHITLLDLPAAHRHLNVLSASIAATLARLEGLGDVEQLSYSIQLAVQEVCTNIVNYAYRGDPGRIWVSLKLDAQTQQLVIDTRDTGRHTFRISRVRDPVFPSQFADGGLLAGGMLFFVSATIVNLGNYVFNLILGRWLGPAAFADLSLIVTLLLLVTFITTGFQQTVAKFVAVHAAADDWLRMVGLRRWMRGWAWIAGALLLALFGLGAPLWSRFFHTQSTWPFVILAVGLPFYFAQGVDRGALQGQTRFKTLALSYQAEMWVRLFAALALVALGFSVNGAVGGITLSLVATWFVARRVGFGLPSLGTFSPAERKAVSLFAASVGVAEVSQILINNSDILIVKHFFDAQSAGWYAALALIGRAVFFATWPIVLAMFPIVAQKQHKGEPHRYLLGIAMALVLLVSLAIIALTAIVPDPIVRILFGEAYLSISSLLWLYSIATGLYSLSNVVINYRLSLGDGGGSALAVVAGVMQVAGLWIWHTSLRQVVLVQIGIMAVLLVALLAWDAWLFLAERRA